MPRDFTCSVQSFEQSEGGHIFSVKYICPKKSTGGKNMAKGENIFKRKDGRWKARYIKGYELSERSSMVFVTARPTRKLRRK